MLTARLSQLQHWSGGELRGDDVLLRGMAIDSRKLAPGALFLALPGQHVDGHDFVGAARQAGAGAALVERWVDDPLPQLRVESVQAAAAKIAAAHLRRNPAKVIAITGSNGKTTVKNLTAEILSRCGPTLATRGNQNNELGLPLTLAQLSDAHQFVVLEMGAGKPGDIDYLCAIAPPHVALVNNVADAHLAQFGTRTQIAETKGAIYRASHAEGVAVINADDDFASRFVEFAGERKCLSFGVLGEVRAEDVQQGPPQRFKLVTPDFERYVELPLLGTHNRSNAMAAAALALAAGADAQAIAQGLAAAQAEPGRLNLRQYDSFTLVDDSYNANPASLAAAIAAVVDLGARRWLVLGDMGELGADQLALHQQAGHHAAACGFERLYALGALAAAAAQAFGKGGASYNSLAELIQQLQKDLSGSGAVVLVKGSRSAGMERVVHALGKADENATGENACSCG